MRSPFSPEPGELRPPHAMFPDPSGDDAAELHPEAEVDPAAARPRRTRVGDGPGSGGGSGARSRSPSPVSNGRGASELYFRELADSHPLTREGEAEIGQRIEAGELACIEAWVRSRAGLAELALVAEDVRAGYFGLDDLLIDASEAAAVGGPPSAPPAPPGEPATRAPSVPSVPPVQRSRERLAELLDRARALQSAETTGAAGDERDEIDHDRSRNELAAGLATLRLDPTLTDRIERSLREARDAAAPDTAARAEVEAAIDGMARARRAVARAKGELVQANLRLAVAIAREHVRFGVPLLDLVQEGNLGLMRAADKFEYRRGHRFSTYAAWWIKQAMRRAILGQSRAIRVPVHLAEARRHAHRVRRELAQLTGREPTNEEVAARSGLSVDKVQQLSELSLDPYSLDAPVSDDGDTRFGDLLAGDQPTPDDALTKRRLTEQMRELVDSLTPREREVLSRRYGLDGADGETLDEIGRSFSVTRERIRQIEEQALRKLRLRSARQELAGYLER